MDSLQYFLIFVVFFCLCNCQPYSVSTLNLTVRKYKKLNKASEILSKKKNLIKLKSLRIGSSRS